MTSSERTLRAKLRAIIATWFVAGMLLLLGVLYVSEYFLIAIALLALALAAATLTLRCPRCHKPVLYHPLKIGPTTIYYCTSWIPRKCSRCGAVLE